MDDNLNKIKDEFMVVKESKCSTWSMVEHMKKTHRKLMAKHEDEMFNSMMGRPPNDAFVSLWRLAFDCEKNGELPKIQSDTYKKEILGEFPIQWVQHYPKGILPAEMERELRSNKLYDMDNRTLEVFLFYGEFEEKLLNGDSVGEAIRRHELYKSDVHVSEWVERGMSHHYPMSPIGSLENFKTRLEQKIHNELTLIYNGNGISWTYNQFRDHSLAGLSARDAVVKYNLVECIGLLEWVHECPDPGMDFPEEYLEIYRYRLAIELEMSIAYNEQENDRFHVYRAGILGGMDYRHVVSMHNLRSINDIRRYIANASHRVPTWLESDEISRFARSLTSEMYEMSCDVFDSDNEPVCHRISDTNHHGLSAIPDRHEIGIGVYNPRGIRGLDIKGFDTEGFDTKKDTKIIEDNTLDDLEVCINCGKMRHEHTVNHSCTSPKFHSQLKTVKRIDDSMDPKKSYEVSNGISGTLKVKKTDVNVQALNKVFKDSLLKGPFLVPDGTENDLAKEVGVGYVMTCFSHEEIENAREGIASLVDRSNDKDDGVFSGGPIKVEIEVEDDDFFSCQDVCESCGSTSGCMCPRKPVKKIVLRDNDRPKSKIVEDMHKGIKFARGAAIIIGDKELSDMLVKPLEHVEKRLEKKV